MIKAATIAKFCILLIAVKLFSMSWVLWAFGCDALTVDQSIKAITFFAIYCILRTVTSANTEAKTYIKFTKFFTLQTALLHLYVFLPTTYKHWVSTIGQLIFFCIWVVILLGLAVHYLFCNRDGLFKSNMA